MTERKESNSQVEHMKKTLEWELSRSGIGQAIIGIAKGFKTLMKWLT